MKPKDLELPLFWPSWLFKTTVTGFAVSKQLYQIQKWPVYWQKVEGLMQKMLYCKSKLSYDLANLKKDIFM